MRRPGDGQDVAVSTPRRISSAVAAGAAVVGLIVAYPSASVGSTVRRPAYPTTATSPAPSKPLAHFVVGIDPGHNGHNYAYPDYLAHKVWNGREYEDCDTTGTQTDAGYAEAEFNFRVAVFLRHDLRRDGAKVVMTRPNNHGKGPCVTTRSRILNRAHSAVAIDIHADGGPVDGRGFTILEPVKDSENKHVIARSARFGRLLRHSVLADTAMPTSTYDGQHGINHRDDLAGLNLADEPKVLIECGNMRNRHDAWLLVSARFQRRIADAMATAIRAFLTHRRVPG
jgi:N-acetylmuramoyl-L-alanine amidase